jgi:hypothetical protein
MTWLATLLVAALVGALGLVASGFIANACVNSYRVSSFEGAAGYFVVVTALLGGIASFVIGIVTSRTMAPSEPGVLATLGVALAVVGGLAALALSGCWLLRPCARSSMPSWPRGDVAMHFAAMLLFVHGKADSEFDWEHRPFLLQFNTEDPAERAPAYRELCERIGLAAE